ncbi:MAG: FGGY-family carbohydrate kinase [Lachnospiraceae bacterium]|nr:FGGY-family carbohydrate kinase [Lachnospiraceae bacterium]
MEVWVVDKKLLIEQGKTSLGIEFGSTRIKAVLIAEGGEPLASGSYEWENQLVNGIWTYSLDDVWKGLQDCYQDLLADVKKQYDAEITQIGSIGFSAMMHGYLAFDKEDNLLVPFRTWRNTITEEAASKLTKEFNYNIPQRWSISHLYQAILNKEKHVKDVAFFTTLAGYVHWKLTGKKVLGVGDASGMFPIDIKTGNYDKTMVDKFDALISGEGFTWKLSDILPEVLTAGENAGTLTVEGAKLLDVSGKLCANIPVCPPEGDAGTGMTATNSVGIRTGNVSAGTSVFAMVVLEKELSKVYPEIDLVTTPDGALVGMVHCNNCTSDLNAWVNIFDQFAESIGAKVDKNTLFSVLYNKALEGDADCGGLISYNYFSGEPVTGFDEGAPLFVRKADDTFNLANFMRAHLYSSLAALKAGLDLMFKEEDVKVDKMFGHGGLFKTKGVGQRIAAAAMNSPVSVMETAGEGGAWGIALLADYMKNKGDSETLQEYLDNKVFAGQSGSSMEPVAEDVEGFDRFMKRYMAGLAIEHAAVDALK